MNTIEEEAKENCEDNQDSLRQYDKHFINAFKDGVEFAQRWIPVEEELPPIGVEVIVKERFNEHEIYVFNSTRDRLIKCQDNCITHWRSIDLR